MGGRPDLPLPCVGPGLRPGGPPRLPGSRPGAGRAGLSDPQSRIMKTAKGFEQCYNAGAAVDAGHQVIVATTLSNEQNDHDLVVLVDRTISNAGETPLQVSADVGYCSERNLEALEQRGIEGFVATGRQKHGTSRPTKSATPKGERTGAMAKKLEEQGSDSPYRLRKHTVEPGWPGEPGHWPPPALNQRLAPGAQVRPPPAGRRSAGSTRTAGRPLLPALRGRSRDAPTAC